MLRVLKVRAGQSEHAYKEGEGEEGGLALCFNLLLFPVGGWRCLPPTLLASDWTGAGAGTLTTSSGVVGLVQVLVEALLRCNICCEAAMAVSQPSVS